MVNSEGNRSSHSDSLELNWETIHKTIADYLESNTDGDPSAERLSIFYDALFQLICGRDGELSLDLLVLAEIVPHLVNEGWLITENRDRWNQVKEPMWQVTMNSQLGVRERIQAMLVAVSITALLEGRIIALKKIVKTILHDQNFKADVSLIGELFSSKGWYENLSSFMLGEIANPNSVIRNLDDGALAKVRQILDIFAFKITQPSNWLLEVVDGIVLPMMRLSLEQQKYQIAFELELELYRIYVKSNETEEHYNSTIALWAPMMEHAGSAFHCQLTVKSNTDDIPKIGFFIHNASTLAHIQLMCSALDGASKSLPRRFLPVVYIFIGYDETLASNLNRIGVKAVWLDKKMFHLSKVLDKFLWLREHMQQNQISACVWISAIVGMAFAFSMRLAPIQIWWSTKFHPNCFNNVDGYITCHNTGDYNVQYFGREWRSVPLCFQDLHGDSLIQQSKNLRSKFNKFDIILGTLAREEKIASPDFLSTIVKILKGNPNVIWLYTGRENHPMIQKYLEAANVQVQSQFIGWVDTKLYVQVIDIFADTWPLGSGLTAMQAMAARKPYIFYNGSSKTGYEKSMMNSLVLDVFRTCPNDSPKLLRLKQIFKIFGNEKLLLNMSTPGEYVEGVNQLIADPIFRKNCGDAYRNYIDEFISNTTLLGKRLGEHIRDIIGIE